MTRESWIAEAAQQLMLRHAADESESAQMTEWATILADSYFDDGYTPCDAVDDELSYA